MPGYEYNPLLKLDLQKKTAVSPSDIQHLEQEIASINEDITDINGDLKNKVPKFFTSIDELEIGEIGQYQGETTDTFVHGYFYQRGTGTTEMVVVDDETLSPTYYVDLTLLADPSQSVRLISNVESSNALYHGGVSIYYDMPNGDVVEIFGFPENNPYVKTTRLMPVMNPCATTPWYAMPKAFNYTQNKWVDFEVEITGSGNWDWSVTIEGETPQRLGGWGYEAYVHQLYYPYPDLGYVPCLAIGRSNGIYIHPMPIDLPFVIQLDGLWFAKGNAFLFDPLVFYHYILDSFTYHSFNYIESPSIERVDAQPSLNPADFATATQGAKADTALQGINHGTDGNYVTSTIGAKDANNEQSVSVSLTLQAMSTAGSGAKGVAEASDVKDYIGNNTATPSQGSKADSALQGVVHGTDGLYITTNVSTKDANNEQTIHTALTLQDIETADEAHKGVAEAANVRNFFNVIAAESEAYGVMWDSANPSPNLTRIGNMRNHALLPVQSAMIGGVLADDGTFTPFDNQADWTLATQSRDGSDGQVMVRLPQHWRRCEKSGTSNIVMISPIAIPGYVEVRQQYVSAYEATLQHSTSKLCSVNNADADYRGGQNEASWDGTYRTLLNRPITNYNLAEFRTFARNRANNTKWNCLTYEAVRTIYWLFVTEYATLNSQADFNSALDANGFRQGGLDIGVSDWNGDSWNAYNGYAPLIPCGILDEYGSGTAIKNFSVYNADTTLAHTFSCNKYRGIEMPFAHIWKYCDGVLVNVESGDGVSTVYATTDTSYFSSTSFANYVEICNSYRVDSFIKDIVFNKEGDIFAITPNGNSTSYYCDQHWGGYLPSATELRSWRFGGSACTGARCGLACSSSYYGVGSRHRYIGSRLCFVP